MKNYHFKTISKQVLGDLHTPVSIYLKVRDIYPEYIYVSGRDGKRRKYKMNHHHCQHPHNLPTPIGDLF